MKQAGAARLADGMGQTSDCIAKPSEALEGTWGPAAPPFLPTMQSQPDPRRKHGEEAERPGVSCQAHGACSPFQRGRTKKGTEHLPGQPSTKTVYAVRD